MLKERALLGAELEVGFPQPLQNLLQPLFLTRTTADDHRLSNRSITPFAASSLMVRCISSHLTGALLPVLMLCFTNPMRPRSVSPMLKTSAY